MSKTLKEFFEEFANEVGEDYKELKKLLTQLQVAVGQLPQSSAVASQIQQAVQAVKSELLDGADAEYDTFKELSDKLKELANDASISGAITQKLTEQMWQVGAVRICAISLLLTQNRGLVFYIWIFMCKVIQARKRVIS